MKTTHGLVLLALAASLASRRGWAAERAVGESSGGSAASDGVSARDAYVERAELVMGTVARVAIGDPAVAPEAFEAAFAALRTVDATMSLYRPESDLVRVNAHAARHPEPVGPELFAVLARARELSVETDGAFDVTVLPLLRLWGAYPELTYLGTGSRGAVGFAGLWLDPQTRTVSFRRQGMGLDLGGVAKGFALERARAALAAVGVRSARLDLGGNLAFLGGGPAGDWRVAVRDPEAPETLLGVLGVEPDGTVSTSANYARDFAAEGWRAPSHVYDPRSGRPVLRPLAVTVWAVDATTADALSTALLVLGPEDAATVLEREPQAGALFVEGTGRGRRVTLHGRPPRAWESGAAGQADIEGGAPGRASVEDGAVGLGLARRRDSRSEPSAPRDIHKQVVVGGVRDGACDSMPTTDDAYRACDTRQPGVARPAHWRRPGRAAGRGRCTRIRRSAHPSLRAAARSPAA